jgi:hypothetical protein
MLTMDITRAFEPSASCETYTSHLARAPSPARRGWRREFGLD